jgi:hypothetical protein
MEGRPHSNRVVKLLRIYLVQRMDIETIESGCALVSAAHRLSVVRGCRSHRPGLAVEVSAERLDEERNGRGFCLLDKLMFVSACFANHTNPMHYRIEYSGLSSPHTT